MRDIDCPKYEECLDEAAKCNVEFNCKKCKRLGFKNAEIPQKTNLKPSMDEKKIIHDWASKLGHLGGLKGGPARAKTLPKEERVRIARKAAMTRWGTLLECPFCHKKELVIEEMDLNWIAVSCQAEECGVLGPGGKTKEEAIKKWNG